MGDPFLTNLEDTIAADLIERIKAQPISEFDLRLPVELRDQFSHLRWLDYETAREWVPGNNDVIGLSCLVTAVQTARGGILHFVDAVAIIHRTHPGFFEFYDRGPEAVYIRALDNRCPHRFRVDGLYCNEDLLAFGERHGWAGEGACWACNRWSEERGNHYVSEFWFSDPMTAMAARMAF